MGSFGNLDLFEHSRRQTTGDKNREQARKQESGWKSFPPALAVPLKKDSSLAWSRDSPPATHCPAETGQSPGQISDRKDPQPPNAQEQETPSLELANPTCGPRMLQRQVRPLISPPLSATHLGAPAWRRGKRTAKTVSPPMERAPTWPPCARDTSRTRYSPSPRPQSALRLSSCAGRLA